VSELTRGDVAVVGAGIAGLTAATVAAERGARVIAYDQLAPGGQLINIGAVVDYPGLGEKTTGPDLAGALLETAMAAGVEIGYAEVTGLAALTGPTGVADGFELTTLDGPAAARAVVVATGRTPGRLDVADAESWVGRGLSECASCDGALFVGKPVAVLGEDEWAAAEAVELAELVERVTVLVPGTPRWSPATDTRLAANPKIEVRPRTSVVQLRGDGVLTGLLLDGAEGTESELAAAGLFVYLGQRRRDGLLDGLALDQPGLFVAGDVRPDAAPYLLSAAADGLRAGLAASEFAGRGWPSGSGASWNERMGRTS
jgi:thioredoxin reductase